MKDKALEREHAGQVRKKVGERLAEKLLGIEGTALLRS